MILDGRETAKDLLLLISQEVEGIEKARGYTPGLAVVRVGDDPASLIYVESKVRQATQVGIQSWHHALPTETSQKDLLDLILKLNEDEAVHGILVQLPLPDHIDPQIVLRGIDPAKDVDGLHPHNAGALFTESKGLRPCTPLGCLLLLKKYNVDVTGKHVLVIGRSRLVGRPVAQLMLQQNATVTMAHSKTTNLKELSQKADIIIAAAGRPKFIQKDWVKDGVIVLDVGINRSGENMVGDVDFDGVSQKAFLITPVPGGVGPMTVSCLLYNTLLAASQQKGHPLKYLSDDPIKESPWPSSN